MMPHVLTEEQRRQFARLPGTGYTEFQQEQFLRGLVGDLTDQLAAERERRIAHTAKLTALVKKWRKENKAIEAFTGNNSLAVCADELSAVIKEGGA